VCYRSSDPPQRLVYLSSGGADPSSRFLYMRSKGLTERALATLGYADTVVFRPAMFNRPERRGIAESVFGPIARTLALVSDNIAIDLDKLAKAMRIAGTLGGPALPASAQAQRTNLGGPEFTVVGNAGSIALAKEDL